MEASKEKRKEFDLDKLSVVFQALARHADVEDDSEEERELEREIEEEMRERERKE